jgi:hypothetical protein
MQVDLHSFETSIISPRLPNGLHSKSCSHQCIMYIGIILQCIHTTALIARLRVSMNIMRRLGRILSTCIAQMDTLGITNVGQQEERNVLRNMVSKNIWNICHLISRWRDVSVRLHTRSFHAKTIWTPHWQPNADSYYTPNQPLFHNHGSMRSPTQGSRFGTTPDRSTQMEDYKRDYLGGKHGRTELTINDFVHLGFTCIVVWWTIGRVSVNMEQQAKVRTPYWSRIVQHLSHWNQEIRRMSSTGITIWDSSSNHSM